MKILADGTVDIDVKVNGKQATAEVNNLKSSLKNVGDGKALNSTTQSFKQLGVVAGLTTSLVSKGMTMVGSSIGSAVDRVDQLNRFPKVLQAMGFSAKDAEGSFKILDKGIRGLPTAMNDIQPLATQLANVTGSAKKGATAAVALNDAFLASGASAQDTSRGLVQMNQMLAAGKVDMQSWKTLTETMSPALKKVAAGFGLVGKTAVNDLYKALQSGQIPMEEFLEKFIELDKAQGGFAETAKIASAGIKTSFINMGTAIVRGIGEIIKALGSSNINSVLNGIGQGFENVAKIVASVIKALSPLAPAIIAVGTAWTAIKIARWVSDLGIVQSAFTKFLGHLNIFKSGISDAFKLISSSFKEFGNIKFDTRIFKEFQTGMQGLVNVTKTTTTAIKNGFKNVGNGIISAFKGIPQGIANIFNGIVGVIVHPINAIKTAISSIGTAFKALGSAVVAHPILLVLTAITVAVASMAAAWKSNFGGIRDFTNAVFGGIGQAFKPVIEAFQNFLKSINIAIPGIGHLGDIFKALGAVLIGTAAVGLALVADAIRIIADVGIAAAFSVKALADALTFHWKAAANDMRQAGKSMANAFSKENSATYKAIQSTKELGKSKNDAALSSKTHREQVEMNSKSLQKMGAASEVAGDAVKSSSSKSAESVKKIGDSAKQASQAVKNYLTNDMTSTLDYFASKAQTTSKEVSQAFASAFTGNGKEATPIEKYTQTMGTVIDQFQTSMKQKASQFQKAFKDDSKKALDALLADKETSSADMLAAEKSLQNMLVTNKTIEGKQLTDQQRRSSNEMLSVISENLVKQNELYINAAEQKIANGQKLSQAEMTATTKRIQQQAQQEQILRQANNNKIKVLQEQQNATQDELMKRRYQKQIEELQQANATAEAQVKRHYATLLTTITNGDSANYSAVISGIQNMKNATAEELAGIVGNFAKLNTDVSSQLLVLEVAMEKAGIKGASKFTSAIRAGDYKCALESMTPQIQDFLSKLPPTFFKGGQKGKDKFIEGLKNKTLTATDLEKVFKKPVSDATNDAADVAKINAEKAGKNYKKGINDGVAGVDTDMQKKLTDAATKGIDALSSNAPKAKTATEYFSQSITDTLAIVPDNFKKNADKATSNYSTGIQSGVTKAKSSANSLKNSSLEPLIAGAKEASKTGSNFTGKWADELGKTGKTKANAGKLAEAGKSSLRNSSKGTDSIGAFFANGFGNGIAGAIPNVVNIAFSLANKAANAVKNTLKIHSPSRLMMEVGKYFSEGFANGIASLTSLVQSAAGGIAKTSIDTLNSELEIHSPSKKTYKSGKYAGQGFANGVQSQKKQIALSVKSLTDMMNSLKVQWDWGKIDTKKYIQSLKWIQLEYKLTAQQANSINKAVASAITKQVNNTTKSLKSQLDSGKISYDQYIKSLKKLKTEYQLTSTQINTINSSIIKAEQQKEATIKKINDSVLKANNEFLKQIQDINKKVVEDIAAAQKAYDDKLKSARDSIYNTVGLFSEIKKLDEGEKPIGANLLYNLGSQVEQMQRFQQDLYTLLQRDVPQDLVKELQKMGVNSANEVAAMTQMTSDQLTQYIALWKQKNAEADKMAKWQVADDYNAMHDQIAQIRVNASKEIDKAKTEWITKLKGVAGDISKLGEFRFSGQVLGKNTAQGLIDGLNSMKGSLGRTATDLARIITNSIKNELKIASPSKVTKKLGSFTSEGFINGIADKFGNVKSISKKLVNRVIEPIKGVNTAFDKLQTMMSFQPQKRVDNVQNYTTVNKLQGIVTDINSRPIEVSVEIDKKEIARATARPIDQQLGNILIKNKRSLNFGGA